MQLNRNLNPKYVAIMGAILLIVSFGCARVIGTVGLINIFLTFFTFPLGFLMFFIGTVNWLVVHHININSSMKIRETLIRMGIIPKYTEVVLFLMSLTFLLLFINNPLFKEEFLDFFFSGSDVWLSIGGIAILYGIYLSIYHAFSEKKITKRTKFVMLFFAVVVSALVGLKAGFYILEQPGQGFFIIFPILNIASALLLLILFRVDVITISSISDRQAKRSEIILGSIAVLFILLVSQFILKNYWAITFSMCVAYATDVNEIINNKFLLSQFRK